MANPRQDHSKQLGQLRPSDTTAASLYSPGTDVTCVVESIWICNQTASNVTYRLFHDDDGTTYDESTALVFDETVSANSTVKLVEPINLDNVSGNLAVRTSVGNALTFTVYGRELT